jgi:lipid II:glycine glycyltransferase (peptidoglycan interpeptide bridge formation enzyme)
MTRKHHGLPPQPYHFFKKIYDHIISKNLGFVVLASHENRNIACAVFFHFGDKAIYKYGASDRNYQHLRANNLVMWEAIKWYCQNGYKSLSFGRTESENRGLKQFKTGWGTRENVINYYKYDFKKDTFTTDHLTVTKLQQSFFRKMPIPLLNIFGSLLYRHIG